MSNEEPCVGLHISLVMMTRCWWTGREYFEASHPVASQHQSHRNTRLQWQSLLVQCWTFLSGSHTTPTQCVRGGSLCSRVWFCLQWMSRRERHSESYFDQSCLLSSHPTLCSLVGWTWWLCPSQVTYERRSLFHLWFYCECVGWCKRSLGRVNQHSSHWNLPYIVSDSEMRTLGSSPYVFGQDILVRDYFSVEVLMTLNVRHQRWF